MCTPTAPPMWSVRLEEGKRLINLVNQLTLERCHSFWFYDSYRERIPIRESSMPKIILSKCGVSLIVPSVTHCILGRPEQIRVTCPSILKNNISQSAHHTKNTQDLSMKRRHLTSVHPSNLFFYFNEFLLSKQPFVFDQHKDLSAGALISM